MKTVTEAFPHKREQANDIKMIVFLSFEKESSMRYKKKEKKVLAVFGSMECG